VEIISIRNTQTLNGVRCHVLIMSAKLRCPTAGLSLHAALSAGGADCIMLVLL